jgi:hypothetical protein
MQSREPQGHKVWHTHEYTHIRRAKRVSQPSHRRVTLIGAAKMGRKEVSSGNRCVCLTQIGNRRRGETAILFFFAPSCGCAPTVDLGSALCTDLRPRSAQLHCLAWCRVRVRASTSSVRIGISRSCLGDLGRRVGRTMQLPAGRG